MRYPRVVPFTLIVFLLNATAAFAADVYVVDGYATGGLLPQSSCSQLLWDIDDVLYNFGSSDADVTLLAVSNGDIPPQLQHTLTLPAGRATSIRNTVKDFWRPQGASVWVYHLMVPTDIRIDSNLFPSTTNVLCPVPGVTLHTYGKVSLPIFRALAPPNQQQIVTGLTVGDNDARINIAIYNGGTIPATGTVEIHRACDGALLEARTVMVSANSIQQFAGFQADNVPNICAPDRDAYAIVTLDQPGFTFGSIITSGKLPTSTVQVSAGTE